MLTSFILPRKNRLSDGEKIAVEGAVERGLEIPVFEMFGRELAQIPKLFFLDDHTAHDRHGADQAFLAVEEFVGITEIYLGLSFVEIFEGLIG